MNIVMNLVLALQIVTALVMIGLVLIQHGKGADVFFLCTLSLAYTANDRPKATAGSVLDRPAAGASVPLVGASGSAAIAAAASGVAAISSAAASGVAAPASAASAAPAIPQK
jgi:preprotein translocase subunit SecG